MTEKRCAAFPGIQKGLDIKAICLTIIASILNALSLMYVNYLLAWLAFPFLIYVLIKSTNKHRITYTGCLFGAISALLLNFWMVPVILNYAQGSLLIAVVCWLASAIVLSFLFGLQFYLFGLIKLSNTRRFFYMINGLLLASLWVLFEWFRAECFSGIPWLSYSVGITEGSNLFLIQPAAYGGVYVLSFLIIFSAYIIGYTVFSKQWKLLYIPFLITAIQYTVGFLLYQHIQDEVNLNSEPKFSVAIIMAALPPETIWNENNADILVNRLLSLNRKAAIKKPNLIVWAETIVPWTYAPDDDFLAEITKEISGKEIHTLVGMNSELNQTGNLLSNSAYLMDPDGKMSGRYDKQTLLTFVEKPLFLENGGIILPFLAGSGMKMFSGSYNKAIDTPWGKAGMMLCNESTNSPLSRKLVQNGASYLVNMGNDGWFSDYFIVRQHFYNSRLRAVETRKDIIINSNMGICGVVKASGEIAAQYDGKINSVQFAEVTPNHLEGGNPQYFIYLIILAIILIISNKMYLMFKSINV